MSRQTRAILAGLDDENRSVWMADKPAYSPSPALRADARCDVAIVGGGFTGVSTAYHLSRRFPDRRVVLLEARQLGHGASGRNGGLMLNWVNGVSGDDLEQAQRIWQTTKGGIDDIAALIAEHDLDVSWDRRGVLDVITDPRRVEAAAREVARLRGAGIGLRFLDREQASAYIALEGMEGAILDPEAGHLDGVDLLRAMKPLLETAGVVVHEGTPVLRIHEGRVVELETPGGTVRADALVLGTNAYTPALGYFRGGLVPVHSHLVATEQRSEDDWSTLGWRPQLSGFSDDRARLSYGVRTRRGAVVFGGGSNAAYSYLYGGRTALGAPSEQAARAVHEQLVRYLPTTRALRVAHRWSGAVALTLSRVCTMGVRGEHRNVYYALGYSGHGITLANLAGRVLTDLYAGEPERWRGLPFLDQQLRPVPPEPLRWVGYQAYTRLTGRSPRRTL
ncbi:MAG: FAD-binding oxidoreductase [Polyangiaceae bacterium]